MDRMALSTDEASRTNRSSTYGKLFGIVVLFFFLGPPIGALTFGALGAASAVLTSQPEGTAGMFLYSGLFLVIFSWFVGGLQAFAAGLAMAVFAAATRRMSLVVPVLAGLLAGFPFKVEEKAGEDFTLLLILTHAISALACGLLAKVTWKL